MALDLLVWYGAASLVLVFVLRDQLSALGSAFAPRVVLRVAVGAHVIWFGVAVASVVGLLPWFTPIVLSPIPLSVLAFGGPLIRLAGGPVDAEHLRIAYYRILESARRRDLTSPDVERIRAMIVSLNRYRTAETSEWIELVQAELFEWTDQRVPDGPQDDARARRIVELGDRLFKRKSD